MATLNLDLFDDSTQTIDESDTGGDASNVVNIGTLGSGELIVDGVDATLNDVASVTAASSPTFTATNGGNLTINQGLLNVSALSGTTYRVVDDSAITLDASSISTLSGLSTHNIEFSGNQAGSFTFNKPSAGLVDTVNLNITGATAGDKINLGGGDWSLDEGSLLNPQDAYRDGALHLTQGGGLLNTQVNARIEMSEADAQAIIDDPDTYLNGGEFTALCFAAGTLIATPQGEVAVETLAIGDSILTASGKTVAVKWIGRQTLRPVAAGEKFQAVRVREGALGDSKPNRDLVLTAGHGLILDDLVIDAGVLVNHSTIEAVAPAELPAVVTYYHVETEGHEVILANGTEAETYVDYIDRQAFDNYAEYVALYGNETRIVEMPHHRISSRRLLPLSVRQRLGIEDPLAALTA